MFIVKYMRPKPGSGKVVMTYEYADRVEEDYNQDGVKNVVLTRFVTGMSAQVANETNVIMDSNGVNGPSALFIENMFGKLIQRVACDTPFDPEKYSDR